MARTPDTGSVAVRRTPGPPGTEWLEFAFIADANGVAALMLDGVFDCVALGCRLARGGSAASCKLVGESGADWLNGLGAWITGDANEASIARVQAGWPFPIPILGRVQFVATVDGSVPDDVWQLLISVPTTPEHADIVGDGGRGKPAGAVQSTPESTQTTKAVSGYHQNQPAQSCAVSLRDDGAMCDRHLPVARYPLSGFRVYSFQWISDSAGAWEFSLDAPGSFLAGTPYMVITVPAVGAAAPTANYDITLIGLNARDCLGSAALNRSATATQIAFVTLNVPGLTTAGQRGSAQAARPDRLRLRVENAGASKAGLIQIVTSERAVVPHDIIGA